MKKTSLIFIVCLICLLVSCDGTVLRDVVDSVPTVGILILDYIGDDYILTRDGISGVEKYQARNLRSVSKINEGWLLLSADGNLSSSTDLKTVGTVADNVSVLTHSGFWVEGGNTLHFGLDKEITLNKKVICAYESNEKLLVSTEDDKLYIYGKDLSSISSCDEKDPVCGFMASGSDYYYLTDKAICDFEGNELTNYSSVDGVNICFAYETSDSVKLVYQYNSNSKTYYRMYDVKTKESYGVLDNLDGLTILEFVEDENLIVTSKNGIYDFSVDEDGMPKAVKKEN